MKDILERVNVKGTIWSVRVCEYTEKLFTIIRRQQLGGQVT